MTSSIGTTVTAQSDLKDYTVKRVDLMGIYYINYSLSANFLIYSIQCGTRNLTKLKSFLSLGLKYPVYCSVLVVQKICSHPNVARLTS